MIKRKIIKDDLFKKNKKYWTIQHTHEQNPAESCNRCNYEEREDSLEDWIEKTDMVATRNPDTKKMEQKPIQQLTVHRGRYDDCIGWSYSH